MEEDDFIELSPAERECLRFILKRYVMRNLRGRQKLCVRQRIIWITDKNFIKLKIKGTKGLLSKGILQQREILGFYIKIKEEFIEQAYNLLDNQDWDLVLQLANIWVEQAGKEQNTP